MAFVTELLGYIGLDVDDASFNEAEQSVKDVTKVMAGLVTIAASVATAVTGAAYAMVSSYAESASQIERTSQRLNINAESFQALTYAAKRFGVEQDQLSDGMKELSMRAAEFASTGGGSAKDALAQLGISQRQVKAYGNDVNGLFNIIRDRISEIKDQGQRQYLSDALFGGGLADVGGEFFSQTAANIAELKKQAMDIGYIIPESELKKADEFNASVMLASDSIKGLWNIVARNLIPIFKEMTDRFNDFIKLHGKDIVDGLTAAINGLITTIKYLGFAAAIAMPYLVGSAAIAGWSKLIALINLASVAFTRMGWAAAIAWAKALWPIVLIGAAILAAIVIIQDLYGYFNGKESITEAIIKSFKGMDLSVRKIWDGLVDYIIKAIGKIDKALYNAMPEWVQELMTFMSGGSYNPNRNYKTQSNLQPDIPGHERIPGYTEIVNGPNRQLDIPGHNVIAPPTMAQGLAQANAGRGNVITTNSGNTTVGEIVVNGAENPAATAQAIRQELRRDNASRTKGSDTGVRY